MPDGDDQRRNLLGVDQSGAISRAFNNRVTYTLLILGIVVVAGVTVGVLGVFHVVLWRSLSNISAAIAGLAAFGVIQWAGARVGEFAAERTAVELGRLRVRIADAALAAALAADSVQQLSAEPSAESWKRFRFCKRFLAYPRIS